MLDNLIASIDVTVSFAHVASASSEGYIRPKLSEKGLFVHPTEATVKTANIAGAGDIIVKAARHPCLEVQDDILFMPNDHEMKKGWCNSQADRWTGFR